MRRPLCSFVSALALAAALAAAAGCEDQRSIDWQVKHLTDSNPSDRSKAIEGISQQWRAVDQGSDDSAKKGFKDKAIDELAKAYSSDALKEQGKDRKKIMDILAAAEDPRAKPAFLYAFTNYKPGDNDDDVKQALRTLLKMKGDPAFAGDDETGKAILAGMNAVNWPAASSGQIGAQFGDALSSLKIKSTMKPLLDIVMRPNSGDDTDVKTKSLTALQVVCAQVLGEVGDGSIVDSLIDVMFSDAATVINRKDPTTGDQIKMASPLTTGVSMVVGGALAKIGEPAIDPLMPFVKDDKTNPKVKAVAEKFKYYISAGGVVKTNAYVDIATQTVSNIGLPKVALQIAGIVSDPKTTDDDRKPLIGLLVTLPGDKVVLDAIQKGYDNSKKLKTQIAASVMRTMEPSLTPWLVGIATGKGADTDLQQAALSSAIWLSPPDQFKSVNDAFDKKTLDAKDSTWRAVEMAVGKDGGPVLCDPAKLTGDAKDLCSEELEAPKGVDKPRTVQWLDKTPKWSEELAIIADVLAKGGTDPKKYLGMFKDLSDSIDKSDLAAQAGKPPTRAAVEAGIRSQKAIWMFAAFATESDIVDLVNLVPTIDAMSSRSFVMMAIDKNLKGGSVKVADAITNLIKGERDQGIGTANRDASQLEPIANKLRARAAAKK